VLVDWLKKAPTSVIITVALVCVVGVLGVLGGFVALSIAGQPTDDYRAFINTLANLLVYPLLGVGTLGSIVAAKSASRAEDNTNGKLTDRDQRIAELEAKIRSMGGQP
jgi:hypothetical protein